MNFDNLQSLWDNDKNDQVNLPTNLDKLKSANSILDKVKANLRQEFLLQGISIALICLTPRVLHLSPIFVNCSYVLYAFFVGVCIYFLSRLYVFYKKLNVVELNTKDSLYETYYDIRLSIELYKSFSYSLAPIAFTILSFFVISDSQDHLIQLYQNGNLEPYVLKLAGFLVLFMVLMGILAEWWTNYYYGRYAKALRKILDELKEE
jgi:hypothetical protein